MRKLSLISIFAVVACGGAHALKDQARDAMPSKDSVAMTTPSSSHASQSSGQYDQSQQNSTVGDASPFFSLTVAVGAVFNVPTAAFLDLLQHVTNDSEPTSCTTTSCTWGPGSAALDYNNFKLVVTKNGDAFDWALSGQAKSKPGSDFVTFAIPSSSNVTL